jgi:hypothetical protein
MSQQTSGQQWEQEVLAADGDFFTALVGVMSRPWTAFLPTTLSWSVSTTGR